MMKKTFLITWKIYKYLILIYSIIYWILIIVDDWVFIENYWSENWLNYIAGWTLWWFIFGLGLSLYFWGILSVTIVIYHKLLKTRKKKKNTNIN